MKEIEKINNDCIERIKETEKTYNVVSFFRVLFFLLFVIEILRGFSKLINYEIFIGFCALIALILLLLKSTILIKKIAFLKNKKEVCQEIIEQGVNDNKNLQFNIDANHPFSNDLDIFGENSLFRKINRCQTVFGMESLKLKIQNPLLATEKIYSRQNAVKELSTKMVWCVDFLASTKSLDLNVFNEENASKLFLNFKQPKLETKLVKFLLLFIPIFNITFYSLIFLLNFNKFCVLIPLVISGILIKIYSNSVKETYTFVNIKSNELKECVLVFSLIEEETFSSTELLMLQKKMISSDKVKSSELIKKLSQLIDLFDNRNILIYGTIINLVFLWELQYAYRIGKYLKENKTRIPEWFEAIGEFEALISFGLFANKNQEFNYPNCSKDFNSIEIKNFAHPFLEEEIRIYNDFEIKKENNVCVITGANMTGKSTFLRAVGVNLVLAMNGCPVCADLLNFYPISIFTSMRTSDSLADGSSYFNAEIKRLKLLIDKLENNEPQFIILDEILKGTNSLDKLKGSELFLEKIIKNPTLMNCLIATHDIELTKMETSNHNVINYCFELYNNNGVLVPDYKLSRGVTKSMNALALMKQFKIID